MRWKRCTWLIHLDLKPSNVKVMREVKPRCWTLAWLDSWGKIRQQLSAGFCSGELGETLNEATEGEVTDQASTPDPQLFKSRAALMVGNFPHEP